MTLGKVCPSFMIIYKGSNDEFYLLQIFTEIGENEQRVEKGKEDAAELVELLGQGRATTKVSCVGNDTSRRVVSEHFLKELIKM